MEKKLRGLKKLESFAYEKEFYVRIEHIEGSVVKWSCLKNINALLPKALHNKLERLYQEFCS